MLRFDETGSSLGSTTWLSNVACNSSRAFSIGLVMV